MSEHREIPGFPGYRVGDDGSVWSCLQRAEPRKPWRMSGEWRRLKVQPFGMGHVRVQLYSAGRTARPSIHRLVLETFVGPCPEGLEGCHGDGDPTNNRLSNLRWGTRIENRADRARHGRARSWSKLTAEHVAQARRMREQGATYREIGSAIGVSDTQASNVCRGKQWKGAA